MQAAVPLGAGGMAAVMGLQDDEILAACRQATLDVESGSVQPANLNAPGQVVISGTQAALDQAIALCQAAGAKRAIALNVSAQSLTLEEREKHCGVFLAGLSVSQTTTVFCWFSEVATSSIREEQ